MKANPHLDNNSATKKFKDNSSNFPLPIATLAVTAANWCERNLRPVTLCAQLEKSSFPSSMEW
jgi:hypothetical protein